MISLHFPLLPAISQPLGITKPSTFVSSELTESPMRKDEFSFQNNGIMTINELLGKPVWQMTGRELLYLAQHGNISTSIESTKASSSKKEKRYVYGLAGIARLFGSSLPTPNRIKQSGKIDRAITQIGRKIIIDAELTLELAGRKVGGRK